MLAVVAVVVALVAFGASDSQSLSTNDGFCLGKNKTCNHTSSRTDIAPRGLRINHRLWAAASSCCGSGQARLDTRTAWATTAALARCTRSASTDANPGTAPMGSMCASRTGRTMVISAHDPFMSPFMSPTTFGTSTDQRQRIARHSVTSIEVTLSILDDSQQVAGLVFFRRGLHVLQCAGPSGLPFPGVFSRR